MMAAPDPTAHLPLARDVIDAAADQLLNTTLVEVREKHERDIVTNVDLDIERRARARLLAATPEFGFLGEETGMTGSRKTYWVLDPVDGTSNFAHGLPLCAVALGLVHHTRPVLGVIAFPWLGRCYWATHDGGAYRDGAEIAAADTSALANALIAIGDYDTTPTARNDVLFALDRVGSTRARGLRRLGSAAVDLAWVADGSLDISITLGNRPWDTAAGSLLAREAGAVVIDADGSQHSTQSRCVVAAAPGLEHEVLTLTSLIHDSPFWQDPTFPTELSTTKET